MKRLCSLLIFSVVFFCFSSLSFAGTTSWGETKYAEYDVSIPGTKLLWSDPLNSGGMNLSTGKMTRGKDADIVFSSDGVEIGGNEIEDLGEVDFDSADYQFQNLKLQMLVRAVPDHVYVIKRANGTLAKVQILGAEGSTISFQYALEKSLNVQPSAPYEDIWGLDDLDDFDSFEEYDDYEGYDDFEEYVEPEVTAIKFKEKLKYSAKPVALTVVASYDDNTTGILKGSDVAWKSSNTNVATVNKNGNITFTGKPGKVTITASYDGKQTSTTTTVENLVKSLSTSTKLAYSKDKIKINVVATYMDGKKQTLKSGVTWTSSNPKVATVSSTGVVTFTGQNGDVTITGTYQGKNLTLKTTVARVDSYYGKWKLWISGTMTDYFNSGNYKYTEGASSGSLTINKDGTYQLNGEKGKWRVAKSGEVFNHPASIILLKALDGYDVAVTAHDRKKGYIKLMIDSEGQYTDGSKIWIFGAEGYK